MQRAVHVYTAAHGNITAGHQGMNTKKTVALHLEYTHRQTRHMTCVSTGNTADT